MTENGDDDVANAAESFAGLCEKLGRHRKGVGTSAASYWIPFALTFSAADTTDSELQVRGLNNDNVQQLAESFATSTVLSNSNFMCREITREVEEGKFQEAQGEFGTEYVSKIGRAHV